MRVTAIASFSSIIIILITIKGAFTVKEMLITKEENFIVTKASFIIMKA